MAVLVACGLCACSDEPFDGPIDYEEPMLVLDAGVMPTLSTRAATLDEDGISNAWVGVYKNGGLVFSQSFDKSKGEISGGRVKLDLNSAIRNTSGDMKLYVVANRTLSDADSQTESDLLAIADDTSATTMAMSANMTISSYRDIAGKTVTLSRNRGKLTVERNPGSLAMQNFEIKQFYLCNGKQTGKVVANAALAGTDRMMEEGEKTPLYSFPVTNTDKNKLKVVVYGGYNGEYSYYCADFVSNGTRLSFDANTWYQVLLQSAATKGYGSVDAALAADPGLQAVIKDHHPKIFNMVKYGDLELGVSDTIRWDESKGDEDAYEFYVKTSPYEYYDETPVAKVTAESVSWIRGLGSLDSEMYNEDVPITDGSDVYPDQGMDTDQYGTRYKMWKGRIHIRKSLLGEPRMGYIDVTWKGLTTRIVVEQKHVLNTLINVDMQTDQSGSMTSVPSFNSYLDFVKGVDGNTQSSNRVYGILPEQNGGLVRNEGLHFPMGLKKQGSSGYASYKYTLTPTAPTNMHWITGITYTVEITDPWFSSRVSLSKKSGSVGEPFTVEWSGSGSIQEYRIASKALKVTYKYKDNGVDKTANFYYDLYHTGFFYNHTNLTAYDRSGDAKNGWHYYEVIPVAESGGTRLWLDRNIGARASGMCINNSGSNLFAANEGVWPYVASSGGGLVSALNGGSNGTFNAVSGLMPPGFRVPSVNEWNEFTSTPNFTYTNVYDFGTSYWSANFRLGDKRVYFPKTGQILAGSSTRSGNRETGYYWTQTEALGVAGTGSEAGKWVQVVKFENSTRSFACRRIMEGSSYVASSALGMSLRCIDDAPDVTRLTRVNFAIKGYTHLYLYYEDSNGNRVGINFWPGDMVIPSVTDVDRRYEYTLQTYMTLPATIKAVLTKVDSNGRVVEYYDDQGGHGFTPTSTSTIPGITCRVADGSGNNYIKLPAGSIVIPPEPTLTRHYRLYWYKDDPWSWKVRIRNRSQLMENLHEVGGNVENINGKDYYYFDFSLSGTANELDNYEIRPEFTGDLNVGWWRKSYNDGWLKMEWFEMRNGRYSYGYEDGDLDSKGCLIKDASIN